MGKLKEVLAWGGAIVGIGAAGWAAWPEQRSEQVLAPELLVTESPEPADAPAMPWCFEAAPDPAPPPQDTVVYLQFNLPLLYLRQQPPTTAVGEDPFVVVTVKVPAKILEAGPPQAEAAEETCGSGLQTHI